MPKLENPYVLLQVLKVSLCTIKNIFGISLLPTDDQKFPGVAAPLMFIQQSTALQVVCVCVCHGTFLFFQQIRSIWTHLHKIIGFVKFKFLSLHLMAPSIYISTIK